MSSRAVFNRFEAGPDALAALGVNIRGSGLIIGETEAGQATAIDLLRADPTRVVVLGSLNLARTIAFRALGLGAQVFVSTWRPGPWVALARSSGVSQQQLTVAADGRFEPPEASETSPVLVIHDTGPAQQESRIAAVPWRTSLHVLNGLHPLTHHLLASADVVILQQLDTRQGSTIGRLLQLPGRVVNQLAALGPFQVVVLSRSGGELVNLVSTPTEAQVFRAIG
jgi:hypothetical protein